MMLSSLSSSWPSVFLGPMSNTPTWLDALLVLGMWVAAACALVLGLTLPRPLRFSRRLVACGFVGLAATWSYQHLYFGELWVTPTVALSMLLVAVGSLWRSFEQRP
jgi:hypothetical protein